MKLAIGSSGVRPNLELTVSECGLDGRFAAIASLEDITQGKPDPAGLPGGRDQVGRRTQSVGSVRGCPVGIQAAKAAGMYAVGLTTTHPRRGPQRGRSRRGRRELGWI